MENGRGEEKGKGESENDSSVPGLTAPCFSSTQAPPFSGVAAHIGLFLLLAHTPVTVTKKEYVGYTKKKYHAIIDFELKKKYF